MNTRKQTHEIELDAAAEDIFAALHTPSAIREWWGAARAIVIARENGSWTAAWGEVEDSPEYISSFRLSAFEPPRRLVLSDSRYLAKSGVPAFQADFTIEFRIEPQAKGCLLRVVQDGFPAEPYADEFYALCETGWQQTCQGIKRFIEKSPDAKGAEADSSSATSSTSSGPANSASPVTGLGGVFFKAQDPEKLSAWYAEHLGVSVQSFGGQTFGAMFAWRPSDAPEDEASTVWSIFPATTSYFAPSDKPFMLNYRVANLDTLLEKLRSAGVPVDDKIEEMEYGRFGWAMDPEGNRIELWEPASGS